MSFSDDHQALLAKGQGSPSSSIPGSSTTKIHVMALDGLVNVNSLFTVAVFVGFSLTTPGQTSLENKSACDAGDIFAQVLLVSEILSFTFFLFSSLVAQGLKLAINLSNSKDVDEALHGRIETNYLRLKIFWSVVGSVLGCLSLLVSMMCVIQIKLGFCFIWSTVIADLLLLISVIGALVNYGIIVHRAFKTDAAGAC